MKADLEMNKQSAISFYQTAYLGNPGKAVDEYVGLEYIQHNPLVGNGKEAFIEYFERMAIRLRWNRYNGTRTIQIIVEEI